MIHAVTDLMKYRKDYLAGLWTKASCNQKSKLMNWFEILFKDGSSVV